MEEGRPKGKKGKGRVVVGRGGPMRREKGEVGVVVKRRRKRQRERERERDL